MQKCWKVTFPWRGFLSSASALTRPLVLPCADLTLIFPLEVFCALLNLHAIIYWDPLHSMTELQARNNREFHGRSGARRRFHGIFQRNAGGYKGRMEKGVRGNTCSRAPLVKSLGTCGLHWKKPRVNSRMKMQKTEQNQSSVHFYTENIRNRIESQPQSLKSCRSCTCV